MNLRQSLIIFLGILLLGLPTVSAQLEGETLTIRLSEDDVTTLDPLFAGDIPTQQVLHSMYVGLTRIDPRTNTLSPGLAESWSRTFLPDDTVFYRFVIREDIPWVRYDAELGQVVQVLDEDGEPRMVSRQDVAYGILRAIDPNLAMENSYALAEGIRNGVDYLNGEVPVDDVGVLVNFDDVAIATTSLDVDMAQLMSQVQVLPQPSWLIEELGFDWATPENFVSYGPYALHSWNEGVDITLISNPYWMGTETVPQPNVDNLRFVVLSDEDALLSYEAGEIDVLVNPLTEAIPDLRDQYGDELTQYPRDIVQFYGLNLRENFPTANPQFRQALAQSLDRSALADRIINHGYHPANRYLPPIILDAPEGVQVLDYDLDQAQAGLASANLDTTRIDLIYRDTDYYGVLAEAVADQWRTTLGIEVTLIPQDFDGSFSNREFSAVWMGEMFSAVPMSEAYVAPFVTENDLSTASMFSDDNYDTAFDVVYGEDPIEDPLEFLRVMETTLLEDVIIIPLSWSADTELTKSNIERTPTMNGIRAFETWFVNN